MACDRNHFPPVQSKPMRFLSPHQGRSQTTNQTFFPSSHDSIDGQSIEVLLVEKDPTDKKQRSQQTDPPII